jgi:hypothetical protein
MYFSKASLHPPAIVLPEHKALIQSKLASLVRPVRPQPQLAAQPPDSYEFPLTTVSLNSNFDAYLDISFKGATAGSTVQLLLDSGNSVLIVPRWEDIAALPNAGQDYQVLGQATEPWGCPANVVQGPIQLTAATGEVYTIQNCVFYACTGDSPTEGSRTANFGVGCLCPWQPAAGTRL